MEHQTVAAKYIKWLEARVGSRLLNRNTRCQSLTEAGQEYLAGCQSLLQHFRALEQNTLANTGQAAGRIRINAPVTFGSYRLTPLLCRFMERYPQIRIELDLSDRLVDVIGDGFDLIFRIGQPKDAGYIARPLTSTGSVFCASPDYLQRHGTPSRWRIWPATTVWDSAPGSASHAWPRPFPSNSCTCGTAPSSATTAAPSRWPPSTTPASCCNRAPC